MLKGTNAKMQILEEWEDMVLFSAVELVREECLETCYNHREFWLNG